MYNYMYLHNMYNYMYEQHPSAFAFSSRLLINVHIYLHNMYKSMFIYIYIISNMYNYMYLHNMYKHMYKQHPSAFAFSSRMLEHLADEVYVGRHVAMSCNSEKEREMLIARASLNLGTLPTGVCA